MNRNYVIICNRHKGYGGTILFWGRKTEDKDRRSFSGYTSDFNICEKYTLEEIENRPGFNFPLYGRDCDLKNCIETDDFVIDINKLEDLGNPALVYFL